MEEVVAKDRPKKQPNLYGIEGRVNHEELDGAWGGDGEETAANDSSGRMG